MAEHVGPKPPRKKKPVISSHNKPKPKPKSKKLKRGKKKR